TSRELERAGERDHVLRLGRLVPVERRMRRRFLEVDRDHVGAIVLGNGALEHVRGIVGAGIELERVQHERPQVLLGNQRALRRANSPLSCRVASARLTAVHKLSLSLAKAMPSRSWVGTWNATVSLGRSFTSH